LLIGALNIFGTTAFGTMNFDSAQTVEERKIEVKSEGEIMKERLEEMAKAALHRAEIAQKEKEEMPTGWVIPKEMKDKEIKAAEEKAERLFKEAAAIVIEGVQEQGPEEDQDISPVVLFQKIGDKVGLDALTVAIFYYFVCAVFLELIITIFFAVGVSMISEAKPKPVNKPKTPKRKTPKKPKPKPKTKKSTIPEAYVKRWIQLKWMRIKNGQSKYSLPDDVLRKFVTGRGEEYNEAWNKKLTDICKKNKIMAEDERIIEKLESRALTVIRSTGIIG
jgi:hypothetical protein